MFTSNYRGNMPGLNFIFSFRGLHLGIQVTYLDYRKIVLLVEFQEWCDNVLRTKPMSDWAAKTGLPHAASTARSDMLLSWPEGLKDGRPIESLGTCGSTESAGESSKVLEVVCLQPIFIWSCLIPNPISVMVNVHGPSESGLQQTTLLGWVKRTKRAGRIRVEACKILYTDLDVFPNELLFEIFKIVIFQSPRFCYRERAKQRAILRAASTTWYRYIGAEPSLWVYALVGDTTFEGVECCLQRSGGRNLNICFQWLYDKTSTSAPRLRSTAKRVARDSAAESGDEETSEEGEETSEEGEENTEGDGFGGEASRPEWLEQAGYGCEESEGQWVEQDLLWGPAPDMEDEGYISEQGEWLTSHVPDQADGMQAYVERATTLIIDTDYSEALVAIRTASRQLGAAALRRLCIRLLFREQSSDYDQDSHDDHPLDAVEWFSPGVWAHVEELHITNIALPFSQMRAAQLRTLCMFGTGSYEGMDIDSYVSVIENAPNLRHLTLANMKCEELDEESAPRDVHSKSMRSFHLKQAGNRSIGALLTRLRFPHLVSMRVQVTSNRDCEDLARSESILASVRRLQIDALGSRPINSRAVYRACKGVEELSLYGASGALFVDFLAECRSTRSGNATGILPELKILCLGKVHLGLVKDFVQMQGRHKKFTQISVQRIKKGGGFAEAWNENFKYIAQRTNKLVLHDKDFHADMEYENLRDWSQECI
ncbi:hypothetical protein DFH06DRAFT_1123083 [Mycena polygramma]|nr:hypothetical protein DFH06DRAFT_1123083 [Mycena polygramma]